MTPAALRQLMQLAEARKARDLAELERLLAEERRLESEIVSLRRTGARDAAEAVALPPDRQAVRLAWVERATAATQLRQAALQTRIRTARGLAAQSLGKHRSLEVLVDRAERDSRHARDAKAEREAPPGETGGA